MKEFQLHLPNDKKKQYLLIAFLFILVIILIFLFLGFMLWVLGICILVGLLFIASYREFIVKVNKDHIIYPSFPKKTITWDDVNNVMLKDGILTIDFKNNKLIQQYLDKKSKSVDESEFNEFCKSLLKK